MKLWTCPCCNRTIAHEPPCDKFKDQRLYFSDVLLVAFFLWIAYVIYFKIPAEAFL